MVKDALQDLVGLLLLGVWWLLFGWMLRTMLRQARPIWRGQTNNVGPFGNPPGPEVTARSYGAFLVFMVPSTVFLLLIPVFEIAKVARVHDVEIVSAAVIVVCLLIGLCGFVLLLVVNAFNRPPWIVPPPHRNEQGWVAARRRVTRRRVASETPLRKPSTPPRPSGHEAPNPPTGGC